ncbi:MAG: hypothetical protein GY820_16115, partial [Gammaproteobacteria bacterium]|nr:hypothetical protein [Gammaproteobacteria bacterium]
MMSRLAGLIWLAIAGIISIPATADVTGGGDIYPWRVIGIGPDTGDLALSGDQQNLQLSLTNICTQASEISESFNTQNMTAPVARGFASSGDNTLFVNGNRLTKTSHGDQVLLAQTIYGGDISLTSTLSAVLDDGSVTHSAALYLGGTQSGSGYGVNYQGDGISGIWAITQYPSPGVSVNVASVSASQHPSTALPVTLQKQGDRLTVTIDGIDIGLAYIADEGLSSLTRYGIRTSAQSLPGDNVYVDDLKLAFTSPAACPELSNAGQWDERYPIYFIQQSLTGDGEITARLVSQQASGVAGVTMRAGDSVKDASVAIVVNAAADNLDIHLRNNQGEVASQLSIGTQAMLPHWLKLKRVGNNVEVYSSDDGLNWLDIDNIAMSFSDTIKAGVAMAVTGSADQLAIFDNLQLNSGLAVPEALEPITMQTVYAEPTIGGNIIEDTELVADQAYEVTSTITVQPGVTLTIPQGVTMSFNPGTQLVVQGNLVVTGSSINPALLTSISVTPARGDWAGVDVQSGGVLSMDNAVVEYATNGIEFLDGSNGTVSNSELRNNTYGLYFPAYSSASPVIIGSLLTGNTRGIYMYRNNAAPTITDSTITA